MEETPWLKLSCGWICSKDTNGDLCYSKKNIISDETIEFSAKKFWDLELDSRKRIASAIGQMLARANSLKGARRVANMISTQV